MVIGAVAVLPHREHQRQIRLPLVLEPVGDGFELLQRALGMEVRVALPEIYRYIGACGIAAPKRDIDQLIDRGAGRHVAKPAVAKDRGLERELRRHPDADLLFARYLSRLVIENGIAASGEPLDAVGAGAQCERALVEADVDLALSFGRQRDELGAPHRLPTREPARDSPEARPPERAR